MPRIVELPPADAALPDGSVRGGWWRETGDRPGELLCELCPRHCKLKPGDRGFCFVRENRDGEMALTTYGRSTGFCIDPIEKKPLNHFYPGTSVLSFGTAGCNLGCRFCQNWDISKSREVARLSESATPEAIARAAARWNCRSVAFTYNDPVIWAEYAIDVAAACREAGIATVAVTAGYITEVARAPFFAAMDAANVDLKAFSERFYHELTASHLQPVLDTLRWLIHESDCWVELTTLLIPGENDSPQELEQMCNWIRRELRADVPLHFSAFHPDFRMRQHPPTPHATLLRAREIALQAGLEHVYVGNVDDVKNQSTYCPHCHELLIERNWYDLGQYHLRGNQCGHCGATIAGRFAAEPGDWGRRRQPVRIAEFASPPPQPQLERKPTMTSADVVSSPPPLSEQQQLAVRRAVLEIIYQALRGQSRQLSDPELSGAAPKVVMGAFVTLKRQGVLRGCCGSLGRPMTVLEAIEQAARRTALEDPRLAPVTLAELPYLDLDVSLLHSFQSAGDTASERQAAVDVGRHGLQIQRDAHSGLLLPSVPVEQHWDGETFLRQVCRKASLPSTAWEDPAARLLTFESLAFGGPLTDVGEQLQLDLQAPPLCSPQELSLLRTHCGNNLQAHLTGATPSYYLTGCPDATVQGAAVQATGGGLTRPVRVSQFSLRPGIPLQATLLNLTQSLARQLQSSGVTPEPLTIDVAVLRQAAMHGTLQSPDLRGIDPQRHAVLVVERGKTGWMFDPAKSPEQLLQGAADLAQAKVPEMASLFSAQVEATTTPWAVSSAPAPMQLAGARKPAQAGRFYPGDAQQLNAAVRKLIGERPQPAAAQAVMAPHAGWEYSGHVAADALKRVRLPSTIIGIGPKHTAFGVEWAVAPHDAWEFPGGQLASDPTLARRLADEVDGWQLDAAAHAQEHGLEVLVPLLAALAPDTKLVGVALAGGDYARADHTARQLAAVLQSLEERPLLLISSDMNHFATDQENRRLDQLALQAMESGDAERLLRTCHEHAISMCGVFPAAIVMRTLQLLGEPPQFQRLAYATSADATGDTSRVVGYAGMLLT